MRPVLSIVISTLLLSTLSHGQTKSANKDLGLKLKGSDALRINLAKEPAAEATKASAKKTTTKDAENTPDPGQMSAVLEKILNNIRSVAMDFAFDITYSDRKVNEKSETYLDINYLNLNAIIKFKDDLVFSTSKEEVTDEQLKKVIPTIKLSTKDMTLVGKIGIAKKSEFTIRICNNYTIGNDYCDTVNDTKLLEFSVFNKAFNKIMNLKLKKITLNFDKAADVKPNFDMYQISGSCEIFENRFDKQTADEVTMAVPCSFAGHYSTNPEVGFKINFKYKNKQ